MNEPSEIVNDKTKLSPDTNGLIGAAALSLAASNIDSFPDPHLDPNGFDDVHPNITRGSD